ncbi:hypothetical protein KAT80_00035 [Candidatus Pacearchaeota archaeon]|nr:hypothetical protein [Candidatus Pacearchaeota archaeon]
MEDLKKIPEQEPNPRGDWRISKEFCDLIDRLPHYSGVVLEDGKSVNIGFMRSLGFDPIIHLDAYIKGAIYAILKERFAGTYSPLKLESKVKEKINGFISEELYTLSRPIPYTCSSDEQLKKLGKEDSMK